MSYCRWSSDDFCCDLYVFKDVRGGWTTHVASRRRVFAEGLPAPCPEPEAFGDIHEWAKAWTERNCAVMQIVHRTPLVRIGLEHGGATFHDASPVACADRLKNLRAVGYVVPQYAIDELRREQEDRKEGQDA